MEENPARWLVEQGQSAQAQKTLARISGRSVAALQVREIKETIAGESGSVRQLLEPRWRCPLLIGLLLSIASQISGINSIIYYGPKIFEEAGFSLGSSFGRLVTIGIILCLATLLAIWRVDTLGRRPLLLVGTGGCALALLLICLFFYFKITSELVPVHVFQQRVTQHPHQQFGKDSQSILHMCPQEPKAR
jgi:SP family arabinose:H+ symporter-like MFS transporter